MIYLDYNATAPIRSEVMEVMAEAMQQPANASSVHALGRAAKQRLEAVRKILAEEISVWPNEVIFTASGTESNNMALRAFADRPLLVGATEHASIVKLAERLGGDTLPVDAQGVIDMEIMERKLQSLGTPALISVMLANNETGVIQPMADISKLAKHYDALLHCDAVQALGKLPVDMGLLGVDMMTLSAHKMGGPVGIGALIIRNDLPVKPLLIGGGQELGRRAGTENIAAAAGWAKAIALAQDRTWLDNVSRWLDEMETTLQSVVPERVVFSEQVERVGNVSCLSMPGVNSETQLMAFDLEKLCVSAGSACSSGRVEPSHVLRAMGVAEEVAGCAIRVSAGWDTTQEEIKIFTDAWKALYMRLNKKAA